MSQLCPEYLIARETVIEYICHKVSFTYGELLKEINKRKGLPQISPSRTLSQYLDMFTRRGALKKVPNQNKSLDKFISVLNI
jgi:hypothetical protein